MLPAEPCAIVIFGASGDLARRKLIPAIYELARDGLLPAQSHIVGFARSPMTDDAFRQRCRQSIDTFARRAPVDEAIWRSLSPRIAYVPGDYAGEADFANLRDTLGRLDRAHGCPGNRLYYLATPPEQFAPVIERLGTAQRDGRVWQRLVVEKPFGHDGASATALNNLIARYFREKDVFRIDHYLGKETVQNLLVLRFANSIFEPVWNYKYIDHMQITVAESLGVGSRGGYYDASGALRDMVQNHLLQLMSLVAMEPPAALDADSIRDEKVKVYRSLRPVRAAAVPNIAVRGQYGPGEHLGRKTDGYRREPGVSPDSRTETFAALKLYIDNWRWSGTPFYLRTGKFLRHKLTEVVVRFRSPPLTLFHKECQTPIYPNDMVIRIQPDEGISLRINGKVPGAGMSTRSVAMDFLYSTTFRAEPPEAYERLVCEAMSGDQTLFIRADEVEAAWAVMDPIEQAWASSATPPQLYEPGSWGPAGAFELIERDGRRWLHSGDEPEPITACSL